MACVSDDEPVAFMPDRAADLPMRLSDVGLYPALPSLEPVAEEAIPYRPAWELWSSGSTKERYLVLPEGGSIDTAAGDRWAFPEGTFLFKTFSFESSSREPTPVETRVMRLRAGEWEFEVYHWLADGSDATLADISGSIEVEARADGETFTHVIPSRRNCRACHEGQPGVVIGFDELRLNAPLSSGGTTQLEELAGEGVLVPPPPAEAERIAAPDDLTRNVLGYLHGNCAHCHNGIPGPSTSFDMRHPVALDTLVGQPTEASGAPPGLRVAPGSPEDSVLLTLFTVTGEDQMPPLGAQRIDGDAATMIERWILELAP